MTNTDDTESLIINGRAVHAGLFEARPIRRCDVALCQSYCCSGGVWIHTRQVDDLLAHQELIIPHLPADRQDPALWFDGSLEPDTDYPEAGDVTGTRVIDDPTHPAGTTCIFLLPDRRCALQAAGIANGEHPWRFKPFYCALHPLVLDDGVLALGELSEMYLEGGSCNVHDPRNVIPVYRLFEPETRLVLGDDGYAALSAEAARRAPRVT